MEIRESRNKVLVEKRRGTGWVQKSNTDVSKYHVQSEFRYIDPILELTCKLDAMNSKDAVV